MSIISGIGKCLLSVLMANTQKVTTMISKFLMKWLQVLHFESDMCDIRAAWLMFKN